ncbi:Vitellogenin-1 [Lucilia cuprina]|nr:Vitellogenin-1 [Lucilia cuprina]
MVVLTAVIGLRTMKPLRTICLLIGFCALATANSMSWHSSRNSIKNSMKPTDWLSPSELESLPSLNEISLQKLENHLTQVSEDFEPSFAPKPSEIPTYLTTPNNQKISFKLNELPKIAKEAKNFGDQEVTIFITGLPQKTEQIKKATRKLVQAYMQRYNGENPEPANVKYEDSSENRNPSSSEEDYSTSWKSKSNKPDGNLVVVDLGSSLPNFKAYATLDIEKTGEKIGDILVQLTDKADVPQEIIHVIGSNIAAHVAGAAARQYTRETGHQLRRVTGLDPSKIYAKESQSLTGLARGDAEFVDAIHTSAYGMGIATRCGDADFFPDGPTTGVSGSENVVEASMRAVRYFAESVVPGNERNFPAETATSLKEYKNQNISGKRLMVWALQPVAVMLISILMDLLPVYLVHENVVEASMRAVRYFAESVVPGNERNFPAETAISLKEYKNQNISGKRVYMGFATEQDVEGDFVLQVNSKAPFGRRAPVQRQQNYVRHNLAHQANAKSSFDQNLTDKADVPQEIIHVIGSNIAAHVAGALRRVTGLDPSKIYAKESQSLTGLARGDAEFVDAIHTSLW